MITIALLATLWAALVGVTLTDCRQRVAASRRAHRANPRDRQ